MQPVQYDWRDQEIWDTIFCSIQMIELPHLQMSSVNTTTFWWDLQALCYMLQHERHSFIWWNEWRYPVTLFFTTVGIFIVFQHIIWYITYDLNAAQVIIHGLYSLITKGKAEGETCVEHPVTIVRQSFENQKNVAGPMDLEGKIRCICDQGLI